MDASAEPLDAPRLTSLSHGAGCACKIPARLLEGVLDALPAQTSSELLVGAGTVDDAAVYRLAEGIAVVSTADFFTPIVDDPYEFGRIAATNALSDVYAMGARPLLALNLVAYSFDALGPGPLERILRGGSDVVAAAGAVIGGGHSIDDREPKYGLAVTGVVDPDRVLTNAAGRADDDLVLTKPLGGGLATTAAKRGLAPPGVLAAATEVMTTLNAEAAAAAVAAGARAATDVTGFGLLGHLHEMALASGLSAEIQAEAIPAIEGVLELAADERCVAGGSRRNLDDAGRFTRFAAAVSVEHRVLAADAMTSGGLLIAATPEVAARLPGVRIGRLTEGEAGWIDVG